jgi:chromosome segregation ATPase
MTLFAKILSFVNIFLVFGVMLLAAPIIQWRQEQFKKIEAELQKTEGKQLSVAEKDTERVRLLRDQMETEQRLRGELDKGLNQRKQLESVMARGTDLLNDSRAMVDQWSGANRNLASETETRGAEEQALQQSLANLDGENTKLSGSIDDLTKQLAELQAAMVAMEGKITGAFDRLVGMEKKLGPLEPKNPAARRVPPELADN